LIETGTFKGDMIEAMLPNFQRLISIELSKELHAEAAQRFAKRPQVSILQGDSSQVLVDVLKTLDQPGRARCWWMC
jgi:16S rRNA A1518/A1519 N6-dimethyltransferase RsmA/KsgA/DIM1 with predicted DNA glycosylase/AP lyase activity